MTYEQAYRDCKSIKEIEEMVKKDIANAMIINTDRIPIIKKMAEKVLNEKYGDGNVNQTLKEDKH